MISLETAKKLKKAGLKWEPETCDTYYWPRKFNNPVQVMHRDFDLLQKEQDTKGIVWAPRLDQLLAEIERREYYAVLRTCSFNQELSKEQCRVSVWKEGDPIHKKPHGWYADTPDEAAAQALLWILEREKEDGEAN